jgi:SAM-dependent methyltransferase
MEIGTGFAPTVPIALYLAGAAEVHTFDIVERANQRTAINLVHNILAAHQFGLLGRAREWVRDDRLDALHAVAREGERLSLRELLGRMCITYTVGDARSTQLPDAVITLAVSNHVLEHVPRRDIELLLMESARVSAPDAVFSHHIDLRDHFARVDPHIGVYNYLQFSTRAWRLLNSRLESQNRLRHSDYIELFTRSGLDVIDDEATRGPERDLTDLSLAAEYAVCDPDDLRIVDMWVAARKNGDRPNGRTE